jgi:DNA replication and repair protein RecF
MKIKNLEIENIRNLDKLKIDFSDELTVIYGKNAQGKTNLLEAIYFLAITKSPRKGREKSIIKRDKKQARVKGRFSKEDQSVLEVEFLIGSKKIGKIDNKISKMRDIVGQALVVMFTAEDLNIIEDPQKRRRFADILISFLDKSHFIALVDYKAAVRRRNKLLYLIKNDKARKDELSFWDDKISSLSEKIVRDRSLIFEKINNVLKKSKFFKDKETILKYKPQALLGEEFKRLLEENQDKDIILCQTTVGPHRDQISFWVDGFNLDTHGSRGEKRSVVVQLKRAEIEIIKEKLKETPVLLLDDVFSELDKDNRRHVLSLIPHQQTIITTTNKKNLGELLEKAKVYNLKKGSLNLLK